MVTAKRGNKPSVELFCRMGLVVVLVFDCLCGIRHVAGFFILFMLWSWLRIVFIEMFCGIVLVVFFLK